MKKTLLFIALWSMVITSSAQKPQEILSLAQKVNHYFMAKYSDPTLFTYVRKKRPSSLWTRAVYYEGLTALIDVTKVNGRPNPELYQYTKMWAMFHQLTPRNGTKTTDADDQCCAQTYIWLAQNEQPGMDKFSLNHVFDNLDHQISTNRYDYWTWIDAIQMAMPLYAMAYQVSGQRRYLDYAIKSYLWSRNECGGGLFNKSNGFWFRDKDYVRPYSEPDGRDCYWSRGNGWVYAALVRVMQVIGKKDPYYKQLKQDFIKMSEAFASCQRPDGLWNTSLISSNYAGKELTGTSLFLYGMAWGINNKLLSPKIYRPICDKAWQGIKTCVHPDGFLGYVQGTGKDPSAGQPVTYTSVPDFEDYGTGCFLLGATTYWQLITKQ